MRIRTLYIIEGLIFIFLYLKFYTVKLITIYENESQIYEWERSRQMFNECDSKKCQMTPNLRRNMQFKRSLFSCHKQMNENSVNTDRKFRAKMLLTQKKKQKIISEFTLFSEIKNDSNKSIKNDKKTNCESRYMIVISRMHYPTTDPF